MTEAKHTPAPWTVTSSDNGCGHTLYAIEEDKDFEYFANAKLISAAPELLEASREALNALLDYVSTLESQGASLYYGRSVIKKLTYAILKTGGEIK